MNIADDLERLHELHKAGAINDDEYALAKARVIRGPSVAKGPIDPEQQTRQWALLLHFSLLAGLIVPLAGLIVPIVIWQVKKNELPGIDRHGRVVVNWIISHILYALVFALLAFLIVGIPLLIALAVVSIVFPIVGGIKASNGEVWKYPLSITFLPVEGTEGKAGAPPVRYAPDAPAEPPQPVAEEKCLRCGRPMPSGAAKCGTCGWTFGESEPPESGTTTRRPGE
jgi:uncharacterized Tic20 family protein